MESSSTLEDGDPRYHKQFSDQPPPSYKIYKPWKRRHLERFPFQPHELGTKTPTMVTITIYKSWEWYPCKIDAKTVIFFVEVRVCFINNSRVFDCSAALMIDRLPGIYVWRMAQHFFSLQVIFLSFLLLPDPDTFAGYLFWGRVVFCGSIGVEPNRVLSNLFADFRNATVTIFDELPKNNVAPSRTPGPRRKLILKKNSVSGVHWLLVYQNYMDVSKNSGIPSGWFIIYNGKPYQNGWFGGTPISGNTHIPTNPITFCSKGKGTWIFHAQGCGLLKQSLTIWLDDQCIAEETPSWYNANDSSLLI